MNKYTKPTRDNDIKRNWHLFDAKAEILGRLSVQIATTLMGKSKPYFSKNMDCGDYVVVINAKDIMVTGQKATKKVYGKYSGFPGGLKQKPFWQVKNENPRQIVRHAVYGMLPKNKLRDKLITRLHIYLNSDHPFQNKLNK